MGPLRQRLPRPLRIVPLALTFSLASLAACSGGERGLVPGPQREAVALSAADIQGIATVLRQEDHRRFDAGLFDRLVGGGSEEVRRRAVLAAGRIGDTAALPLLTRSLTGDPSAAVRADAAFALGELGDGSAAVLRALDEAVAGDWTPVRAEQTTVVVEVLAALGKLGSEPARQRVVTALREAHPARDPHSRRVAAEALLAAWRFDRGPGHLHPVSRYLDSRDPELRWRAVYALMRGGDPDAVPLLLPSLEDDDHRARALAARALTGPRSDTAGLADSARTALTGRLADPHPHVRINALRSLASHDGPPVDVMARLLRDPIDNVAVAAANALGAAGEAARAALVSIADHPEAPRAVRAAAVLQLAEIDGEAAASRTRTWAAGEAAERYEAARLLAALGWDRGGDLFDRLARDEDTRVAVAALAAAEALASDSTLADPARQGLRTLLLDVARSPDPRRRAVALRGLGPVATADDLEALLDAYRASAGDTTARPAAIAAVEAIASLQRRGVAPGAAEAFRTRVRPSRDRWIARAVAEQLTAEPAGSPTGPVAGGAAASAAETVGASEDPAFYRRIVREYVARPLETGERPEARIDTRSGELVVELLAEEAPLTVHNFVTLARAGFYDHGVWHRVVPNFVLQDGAPGGDPSGGPGWRIRDEMNRVRYQRGTVGMALSGPDTGGSQWFITHSPQPHLDGAYTVFGRVVEGMDAADAVLQGDPIHAIGIRW